MLQIEPRDLAALQAAKNLLENPGFAMKVSNVIGKPVEWAFGFLPEGWENKVGDIVQEVLLTVTKIAVSTMDNDPGKEASNWWHKAGVAITGGAGGALGLAALPFELPVSTTIMLRSIADVARSEGADLSILETRLKCVEVLALGGNSKEDDAADSGYWAVRASLARNISEAASYLAKFAAEAVAGTGSKGAKKIAAQESAPALVQLIDKVAQRFGTKVTEAAAAKAVPVVGGVAGAIINTLFIDHFQDMARGHFTVLRLETKYGKEVVKREYLQLSNSQ